MAEKSDRIEQHMSKYAVLIFASYLKVRNYEEVWNKFSYINFLILPFTRALILYSIIWEEDQSSGYQKKDQSSGQLEEKIHQV